MTGVPRPSRIDVIRLPDQRERVDKATETIARIANRKVLFVSGGNTPVPVYEKLTTLVLEGKFRPVAMALVDERIDRSNEKMIRATGLPEALQQKGVKFCHLRPHVSGGEQLADLYESDIRLLSRDFEGAGNVGVMGIGVDGHTAGIGPNHDDFRNPLFTKEYSGRLVGFCNDSTRSFQHVTLTPYALRTLFRRFIVLAWGEEKRELVENFLKEEIQPIEQFPAAVLKESGKQVTVITG